MEISRASTNFKGCPNVRAGGLIILEIGYSDVIWSIFLKNVKFVQIGLVVFDLFNFQQVAQVLDWFK